MNYSDYITEYLGAGLVFSVSLGLAVADASGAFQPQASLLGSAGAPAMVSITSLPGALALLLGVFLSYPIGYLLFVFGLRLSARCGRRAIYERETAVLQVRPYADVLAAIRREAPLGYAGRSEYEIPFSLVRLYLLSHHSAIFSSLNAYWTRLSRMFCALMASLLASAMVFLVLFALAWLLPGPMRIAPYGAFLALLLLSLALLAMWAYRTALTHEIRVFVATAMNLWAWEEGGRGLPCYVFAYGSNMLTARLRQRCPSAKLLGRARLPGYRLVFNKWGEDHSAKANILKTGAPEEGVEGVVFELAHEDLARLDEAEHNYERVRLRLQGSTGPQVLAYVYQAKPEAIREQRLPYDWYLALMLAGAAEHELPGRYQTRLAAQPCCVDGDRQRQYASRALLGE